MDFVKRLEEIEAIKQLKYRYMRCIDQKLWKEMETCFTPDATCSYSGGKYSFHGRDAIMKFLIESMDRPTFLSSHRVHQPEIELTSATTATGIWALEDWVIDEQHGISLHGAAFYRDQYVKPGGAWKIQHTGYERTFEEVAPRKSGGWQITQRGFGG
jgi:bile-acid 7alpha-dehydratase